MMPPVLFDLWLLVWQLTIQILQCGIYFFKVHLFSLQECSLSKFEFLNIKIFYMLKPASIIMALSFFTSLPVVVR